MSPSTFRSIFIVTAAAGVALLTSCSSTPASSAAPAAPMPDLPAPVQKVRSMTVTPSKARPGARPIQYYVIEIKVPDQGGEDNFITRHLRAVRKGTAALDRARTPSPRHVPQPKDIDSIIRHLRAPEKKVPTIPSGIFPSLRELSQIKGVDLMNVGKAREGQTLRSNFTNSMPFPDEFSPGGKTLSSSTTSVGVKSSFHGELEGDGDAINLRGSFDVKEFTGFTKYALPSGLEVLQPTFSKRAASFDIQGIPNGGFVIFADAVRSDVEHIEDVRLGGLLRTKSTRTINRYLAIGATTEPL